MVIAFEQIFIEKSKPLMEYYLPLVQDLRGTTLGQLVSRFVGAHRFANGRQHFSTVLKIKSIKNFLLKSLLYDVFGLAN
jgi:hypothetical protein